MKLCKQCNTTLSLDQFHKDKSKKDGYRNICKECASEKAKLKYENNKDTISIKHKEYWQATKEERNSKQKEYRENNKDKVANGKKNSRIKNIDHYIAKRKEHYENNKEYYKQSSRVYIFNRRRTDPLFRILDSLRRRLYTTVKFNRNSVHSKDLLGCTLEELKIHLQSKFVTGMTFENYGKVWHIDHIRPCASFNLEDEEQQKICFNYTNLQPLFAIDNIKKGTKLIC